MKTFRQNDCSVWIGFGEFKIIYMENFSLKNMSTSLEFLVSSSGNIVLELRWSLCSLLLPQYALGGPKGGASVALYLKRNQNFRNPQSLNHASRISTSPASISLPDRRPKDCPGWHVTFVNAGNSIGITGPSGSGRAHFSIYGYSGSVRLGFRKIYGKEINLLKEPELASIRIEKLDLFSNCITSFHNLNLLEKYFGFLW